MMLTVLLVLVVIGVCLYLVENFIPMSAPIKTVLRVVVIILLVLWLLRIFGVTDLPIPQVR
jgi:cytochrome c biogenesis protein CcdA